MKKLFMALGLIGLLAGCASHDMGGTSDENQNNAAQGTGSSAATNNAPDHGSMSQ